MAKRSFVSGIHKLSATLTNPTVRPLTDRHNPTDNSIFGKAVWLSLRKIKRATSRHTSQRFCSTFNFAQPHHTTDNILPNQQFFTVYLTR